MLKTPLQQLKLSNPIHFLALGFGAGLIRPAPGTWGSMVGLMLGWGLLQYLNLSFFFLFTALCFALGCYLCQKTAEDMGVHDHGAIVWDEIVGIFVVLLSLPNLSPFWCLTAFILFRFFDILKPYPIRYFDHKLESGLGIMLDDILAAIYAVLVIFILRLWF
ncbi:phosphatidylglycerophosphatase A family protein [Pasteurella multocida]|uniref:phosphatidylglycerophosphatase A family protein n=1 Tax=Pasteurella multocida TaxID=747 RepID=UPI000256A149|nr:phosphatidylglycerophosphatase A [Pasteurella multocida]AFF24039.1 phosphatidylglycerophosphatase A [Pasteurella multocida subsp. multocida str. HN06]MCL7775302.1 phosphatidylglycerophosphatase A [Pasteurella multocida]MCL8063699.1 phosphatidylglycerophosphatase A [Pasteurella multocida]MCL8066387.1 phosphatidylglycerophosphatase A [Pasteurella multocida]MCW4598538.1 phosphatidylglycerophosphatase A [Pasteurella multocida subsp. multocida]